MTQSVDVREFLQGFLSEADEHLGRITSNLSTFEAAPSQSHPRAIGELFRSLHTLKGLAGMMGVDPIVDLAHAMESLVRRTERRGGRLAPAALDPLVAGTKAITQRVRALADGAAIQPAPESILLALERLADQPGDDDPSASRAALSNLDPAIVEKLGARELDELRQALERGDRVLQVVFAPSPEKAAAGRTITTARAGIGGVGRIVKVLPRAVPASTSAPGGLEFAILVATTATEHALAAAAGVGPDDGTALASAPAAPELGVDDDAFDRASRKGIVRIDVAKLDVALEQLSGLGIGQLRVREEARALAETGVDLRRIVTQLEEQDRRLRRMRATLLGLRMVPLREVLEPLPLIVRGLRNTTGKAVELEVDVGDAELDKTVAERLFPALVHLVRNAVDHGIEPTDERRRRGKPDHGRLRVESVAPSTAMLDIAITDDGGGIDPAAIAKRAGRAVPADDRELLDILTTAGFSSRDQATTTSGRGLGLDIVRHTIEALGGALELDNRPGLGTTFRIRAPLTVAVLDAFAFVAGDERYLAPISVVDAIVEVDPAEVVRPPRKSGGAQPVDMLHTRGDVMPLVSLRDVLGLPRMGEETRALLVRRQGRRFAFAITRMLGRHEVLVRPLVDALVDVPGISGSADLGDGRPTLVLDLPRLGASLARAREALA
ncbi:MAG TPA: chemotaxis protein CheW [Nannocystaceae bacterium]|nr:chemotaxis protein CheW [Nannocystaceae bacterium]